MDLGPAQVEPVGQVRRQAPRVHLLQHRAPPRVERVLLQGIEGRVHALRPGEGERRLEPRLGPSAERQHPAERLAVVADADAALALEAHELHPVAGRHLQVRRQGGIIRALGGGTPCQPVRQGAQGLEELGAHLGGGRGAQQGRRVANAQRLRAGGVLQERHHRLEPGHARLVQGDDAHLLGAHVAGALAAVVVHLEEAEPLAPDLQPLALPERGLTGGGVLGRGAQGRLVLHHEREGDEGGEHGATPPPRRRRARRGPGRARRAGSPRRCAHSGWGRAGCRR